MGYSEVFAETVLDLANSEAAPRVLSAQAAFGEDVPGFAEVHFVGFLGGDPHGPPLAADALRSHIVSIQQAHDLLPTVQAVHATMTRVRSGFRC